MEVVLYKVVRVAIIFGFTEFSKEMLNDMMDHPKLYGKVEHYKDFNEYRQLNAGREKALKKI